MNIKQLIILFLILLLVPVFMGKVPISQFSGFFQHPSWDGFKLAFTSLFQDDFNYYKSLVAPWNKRGDLNIGLPAMLRGIAMQAGGSVLTSYFDLLLLI
jgi:hypothetical protein